MVERLLDLIVRLKNIFLRMETNRNESTQESAQLQQDYSELTQVNTDLNNHIVGLREQVETLNHDHIEALSMLDELEEVIKKWES